LYTLDGTDGARWRATPLVEQFRRYVGDPESSIGRLPAASASEA
jgi:hypothetical protein